MVHTQSAGKGLVEPLDVLVALMSETDSHAVYFLKLQSVTRFEVLRCIAHGSPDEDEDDGNYFSDGMDDDNENRTKPGKTLYRRTPSTSTPKSKPAVSIL